MLLDLATVMVPRNTSQPVAGGRVVYAGSARLRTENGRETGRWLKVDPAIASKVDLRPQVGIDPVDQPLVMLGIGPAVRVTIHHAGRHTQEASHDCHRRGEVVTESLVAAAEEEPRDSFLARRQVDIHTIFIMRTQIVLQGYCPVIHRGGMGIGYDRLSQAKNVGI